MAAPHSVRDPTDDKAQARRAARAARAGCDPALGTALARHVLQTLRLMAGATISGYWPIPGEIDIRPLLGALHALGHAVLLPVTPPRGEALRFRRWRPGDVLMGEKFGTFCPGPQAPPGVPDILFVPLLAFDRLGRRLGYGGGYYDRTLAGLPDALAVGCAFAAQEMAAVPAGSHDFRLHAVATEDGVIRCQVGKAPHDGVAPAAQPARFGV